MIEFLAGGGKVPQVAVQIDARPQVLGGYDFVRPGQHVVEIVALDSKASLEGSPNF